MHYMQNMYQNRIICKTCIITAYSAYLTYNVYIFCAEPSSPGHPANSSVQQQPGSHCSVLDTPYREYTPQGSSASLLMAICAEEIATDQ